MKAIIKCYGKSYLVLGVLTFLEVKAFPYSECIDFEYMWVSPEMDGLRQGEDSDLRSEGKSHLGIMM